MLYTLKISSLSLLLGLIALSMITVATTVDAFCGFYVAKADTKLFNKASKVIIARHDNKTVITMANDYQGNPGEFALVIPVPTVLEQDQIHVTEPAIIDHLDAYTAPRLVEYFDPDPCRILKPMAMARGLRASQPVTESERRAAALGVTIEAAYTVGEYDILILSAQESSGLMTWLVHNGYTLPAGARPVIGSYLDAGMKFFVAKVNLTEHARQRTTYLRPLQIAFASEHFMLPIRLGTINANGPQELFIFTLTRHGRVETANYQTRKLPSNVAVPLFVKQEFGDFYRAVFDYQVQQDRMRTVFLEYAWDMGWCDPCAADPLSVDELRELGVFWQEAVTATGSKQLARIGSKRQARDVFVTRLHVRYTAETFAHDLQFRDTTDRTNFQGRYILRYPWQGDASKCQEAKRYLASLPQRFESEAQNLARLTGWDIAMIRRKMATNAQPVDSAPGTQRQWYQKLWKK